MALGDFASLLKGFKQVQQQLAEVREKLEAQEVEGQSGGGMVVARVNGRGELLAVRIEPEVVDPANKEFLEDLVRAAVRQAVDKSHELMQQEMGKVLGGLGIPGLENVMNMF